MTRIQGRDPKTNRSIEVIVEEGRIVSREEVAHDSTAWISPGQIDLQVNGFGGFDLNAEGLTPEIVLGVAEKLLKTGVTKFLPTIITQSEERIVDALRSIRIARESFPLVAKMVPGVHVEGPFISPVDGYRGAHSAEHVRPPSISEVMRWQHASGDLVRLITMSPHYDESSKFIQAMRSMNIHVAIGHTHCSPDQVRLAASAGARLSTHLGNGVASVLPRHPNMIWAQLAEDNLSATFISDGHHLPGDTLSAMIRAKGLERSILISDCVALAGMPPGLYEDQVGGRVELEQNGKLHIAGSELLAGAAVSLKETISQLLRTTHLSLAEALQLATRNPAYFLGYSGTIDVGERADLITFHITGEHEICIESVWLDGEPLGVGA